MKTRPAYFVIDTGRRVAPVVARVTQRWPAVGPDEVVVRCSISIPDPLLRGAVYELVIDDPNAIAVVAEPVAIEPPEPVSATWPEEEAIA